MKLSNLIAGLEILKGHFNKDCYSVGADNDIIYVYETDTPLTPEEVVKMVELGWFQYESPTDANGNFTPEYYDQERTWAAYV